MASKPVAKTMLSSSYSVARGPHAPRRDRLDRLAADVDQGDVVAVEGVVVVGVDADALGAERIVPGGQRARPPPGRGRWRGSCRGRTRRRCRWPPAA